MILVVAITILTLATLGFLITINRNHQQGLWLTYSTRSGSVSYGRWIGCTRYWRISNRVLCQFGTVELPHSFNGFTHPLISRRYTTRQSTHVFFMMLSSAFFFVKFSQSAATHSHSPCVNPLVLSSASSFLADLLLGVLNRNVTWICVLFESSMHVGSRLEVYVLDSVQEGLE